MSDFIRNLVRRGAGVKQLSHFRPDLAVRPAVPPAPGQFDSEEPPGIPAEHVSYGSVPSTDEGPSLFRPEQDSIRMEAAPPAMSARLAGYIGDSDDSPLQGLSPAVRPLKKDNGPEPAGKPRAKGVTEINMEDESASRLHGTSIRPPLPSVSDPASPGEDGPSPGTSPGDARQGTLNVRLEEPPDAIVMPRGEPTTMDKTPRPDVMDAGMSGFTRLEPAPADASVRVPPDLGTTAPQVQKPGSQSDAASGGHSIQVRIGKVEIRTNPPPPPPGPPRRNTRSGFADLALRRAHLDRNYR